MTFKNEIAFLVMIISDLFTASSGIHDGPIIVGNKTEYNIEPNANYSILCEGNKPLKWRTPEIKNENLEKWTQFKTEQEAWTNKKYGLRLYITNMSYPFVGSYYCHYEDAKNISENNNENTSIYLYVNDTTYLTVNTDTDIQVYVETGDVAVLPCRPTSPNVTVELLRVSPDYTEVPLNGTQKMFRYDPHHGIFTNYTDKEGEKFEYRCFFTRNDEESRISIDLYVEKPVSQLPTPYLIDANRGHTVVGGNVTLNCKNVADVENSVTFSWETPGNSVDSKRVSINNESEDSDLTVTNVTLDDMGVYVCTVSDHHGHSAAENVTVNIFDKGVYNISMKSLDDSLYIERKTGNGDVILTVNVWGHPPPEYTWFDRSNNAIPSIRGKKYEVTSKTSVQRSEDKSLRIKNIDIDDTGNYTLLAKNQYTNKSITFFVNITDQPSVSLETDQFHLFNQTGEVRCIAKGNPTPELKWEYKHCLRPGCKYTPVKDQIVTSERLRTMSVLEINATESGLVKCIATNALGERANVTGYKVTDVPDGFAITDIADTAIVDPIAETAAYALNENVSIKCSADASNYSQITWLLDLEAINETNRIRLIPASTNYSKSVTLKIYNSHRNDSGEYTCRVVTYAGAEKNLSMNILIQDPVRVGIIHTNMEGEMVEDYPKSVKMICKAKGLPKPKISWYKDDVNFDPKVSRIRFEDSNQILVFNETAAEDAGRYRCEAVYKKDIDFREIELRIKNAPEKLQRWFIYVIILLGVALGVSVIYLILRVKKERKMKRELQLLGLANFEKGAIENINPELGIDDQAELLPYDKKWEFPIEQLKLGKQLGSGAFGIVLKGEAKYIIEGEPVTTVAVKMVKKTADNTYLKALASELKIMVHLGKHLNVVNLLGACTKNVAKRELLVIVEYCRFGNLQNYLLKHREHFVNQIDPQTGKVNYLIGQELLDRTYSVSSDRSNINSPLMRYATLAFSDQTKNCFFPTDRVVYSRVHQDSENSEMTSSIQGDDSVMLSNNSTQPEWRSNYKGDYKGNVNPISTRDLITYAFQIARGMEYLASRKVLHGDLATRNILLSENNIVKICDFGLAKTMYKNENYRKRGDCPLPVKWMAIESIRDRIFSTQSDCWSFGIVLWELFSLGRTPYPGMPADERLYQKLVDGYRLECPEFCPKEIYKIMTECWSVKPSLRPSFTQLTERIGSLIEDTLRKHYVDLNDPYLAINTMMLEKKSDYLSMISPPDFDCIVTPNYVNDMMTQSPCPEDGYMSMKPNTVFSPRIYTNEKVFNFDIKNRKNCPSVEIVEEVELTPILKSPESNGPDDKGGQEIIKSVDNYVNMPQNKSLNRDKNMERNYVNDNTRDWGIIH